MDIRPHKLLPIAGLVFLLSACMGPNYFEPQQASNPTNGMVYIYRPEADNPGRAPLKYSYPEILIDGQSIGTLKYERHLVTELSAGEHHIRITGLTKKANWEARDIEQDMTLSAGEIKYLKLDVRFNMNEMNLGQPGPKYIIFLTPISPQDAIYEIRETKAAN